MKNGMFGFPSFSFHYGPVKLCMDSSENKGQHFRNPGLGNSSCS